eukprot:scaffold22451_cov45-Attheya_sp.AAC.3
MVVAPISLPLATRPRGAIRTRTLMPESSTVSRKPKLRNSFSALLDKEVDDAGDDQAEPEELDGLLQDFEGLSDSEGSMPKKSPFAKSDPGDPIPTANLPQIDVEDANMTPAETNPPAKKKNKKALKKELAKSKKKANKAIKAKTKLASKTTKPSTPAPARTDSGLPMVTPSVPTATPLPLLIPKRVDNVTEATTPGDLVPGSSRADPDTSLLNHTNSSDDEATGSEDAGLSVRFQETNISTPSATSAVLPDPVQHQPPGDAMQGVEVSNKTLKGTEYRRFSCYLMWEDIPAPVLAAVPDGISAHIMQLWVAMALDYLRDQGFEFQVSPLVDTSPLKALQRNTETFADMCKPENCSLEDFEEYFEIQPYFTTYFDRVQISMILRLKEGKTSAEYMAVLPFLRDKWSVVVGVDPGLPPPPAKPRFDAGFLHGLSPKDRQAYFLACCGVNIVRTNLLRFSCNAKSNKLPSSAVAKANGPTPEKLLQRHMGEMLNRLQDIIGGHSVQGIFRHSSDHPQGRYLC